MTAPFGFQVNENYAKALRDSTVRGQLPRDPYGDSRRLVQLTGDSSKEYIARREYVASILNREPHRRMAADTTVNQEHESIPRDRAVFAAAKRHGVPTQLALAVSHTENWRGAPDAIGPYGEVGVMQVNPPVWAKNVKGRLDDLQVNADAGVRILRLFFEKHGSWEKAVRAYNGSPNSEESTQYLNMVRRVMQRFTSTDSNVRKGFTVPDMAKLREDYAKRGR